MSLCMYFHLSHVLNGTHFENNFCFNEKYFFLSDKERMHLQGEMRMIIIMISIMTIMIIITIT